MNRREMTKLAKEYGYPTADALIEEKCPSEVGCIDNYEICGGGYDAEICKECWKDTAKEEYRLTRKAFDTDEEYAEYVKRCEEPEATEQVNHPSHYQQAGRRECIEEMRLVFGDAAVKQWCIMTAYKYRYRTGNKEGNSAEQDNKKAEWYLDYAEEM